MDRERDDAPTMDRGTSEAPERPAGTDAHLRRET
jgi:hypothetical protein